MNQSSALELGYRFRTTDKQAEEVIIGRACAGDKDAFGQLYDLYVDRIYRYVFFRVTDENIADDLTAIVFMKAWENLDRYRISSKPFVAWLYTIAHNAVIDHYRTSRSEAGLDEAMSLRSPEPLPDEQSEMASEGEALKRALQQLTPAQRDVVAMRLIQGMDTDEIAHRIGKTAGAVRALQMRALRTLGQIYTAQASSFSKQ